MTRITHLAQGWRAFAVIMLSMLNFAAQAETTPTPAFRTIDEINARQAQIEAQYQAEDQACLQRFAVSDCRDRVQKARQLELDRLRAERLTVKAQERQLRAQAAQRRLEQRQAEHERRRQERDER
jgi:hypothetical protein